MKVQELNDIRKETKNQPETFVALAGEVSTGNQLLAGLEIGTEVISQYRSPSIIKPYMQVVPDMGIDPNYASFYHAEESTKEKYFDINTAMTKYNDIILSKVQDPKEVEQYLIKNIPTQKQELSMGYIKGEGYRSKAESCIILASTKSKEQEGEFSTLIYSNGQFSVMDKVQNDRFGTLDLQSVDRPEFKIDNIQEALDEFAIRTKTIEEVKEHSAKEIEGNLEGILEEITTSDVKEVLGTIEYTKDQNREREE